MLAEHVLTSVTCADMCRNVPQNEGHFGVFWGIQMAHRIQVPGSMIEGSFRLQMDRIQGTWILEAECVGFQVISGRIMAQRRNAWGSRVCVRVAVERHPLDHTD